MTRSHLSSLVLVLAAAGCEQVERLPVDEQQNLPCEVQRILTEQCAIEGGPCHAGIEVPDLRAGAAAQSITSLSTQGIPYVDFGNLAGSYMAIKIMPTEPEGAPPRVDDIMPQPPGMITEDERALLVGWMAGAELEACGGGSGGDDGTMPTTSTGGDDDVAGDSTTGSSGAMSCATDDVVTAGEKTIDAGTGAGQIPPDIAGVLEGNCGCHYGTMTNVYVPYPEASPLDMTTLAGFEAPDVNGSPAVDKLLERLDNTNDLLHMPPVTYCSTEDGDPMPPADYDLLKSWLEAGVPDGATWDSGGSAGSGGSSSGTGA